MKCYDYFLILEIVPLYDLCVFSCALQCIFCHLYKYREREVTNYIYSFYISISMAYMPQRTHEEKVNTRKSIISSSKKHDRRLKIKKLYVWECKMQIVQVWDGKMQELQEIQFMKLNWKKMIVHPLENKAEWTYNPFCRHIRKIRCWEGE